SRGKPCRAGPEDDDVVVGLRRRHSEAERVGEVLERWTNQNDLVIDDDDRQPRSGNAVLREQLVSRFLVEPLVRLIRTCQKVAQGVVGERPDEYYHVGEPTPTAQ